MKHHLANGTSLAKITTLKTEKGQVIASVDSETKLAKAELHYTLDALPGKPQTRKWVTLPATLKGNTIIADAPPKKATIWFLTLEDASKTLVSSKLIFPTHKKPPKK